MAKEFFENTNFRQETVVVILQAIAILDEYADQGYDLSLRQLYYQLVSRDLIPNTDRDYKRLGGIVKNARLAGVMDWEMIVDRGRWTDFQSTWETPAEIMAAAVADFRIDKWETQGRHIEVMVEKAALEGVLIPVCHELQVRFTANKGYLSTSAMYKIGKRLRHFAWMGKTCHVLYLGDHDPSGLDMDRDIYDRLDMFSEGGVDGVKRLALTMDQINEYNPPENPTKLKDSRASDYIYQYGMSSWELDALEPSVLAELVTSAVINLRQEPDWIDALKKEAEMREQLEDIAAELEEE